MSKMDRPFKRTAIAAVLSLLTMAVLPACEKGLLMKDPKITTPDFEIKVQAPEEKLGERTTLQIDLKNVDVSKTVAVEGSTDPKDIEIVGMIKFQLGAKEKPEAQRLIQVDAVAKASAKFNVSGKIESKEGEPLMSYQARCSDDKCSFFYMSILLDFQDENNHSVDMKFLVISVDTALREARYHLFDYDLSVAGLTKQIAALNAMNLPGVKMAATEGETEDEKSEPTLQTEASENGPVAGTGATENLKVDETQAGPTASTGSTEEKALETAPSEEVAPADAAE